MNQQALEAAAKAAWASDGATSEGGKWGNVHPELKAVYHNMARAALTAYAEASGERVVWTNTCKDDERAEVDGGMVSYIKPGEELVIRKVGT